MSTMASATEQNKDVDAKLGSRSPVADRQNSDSSSKSAFYLQTPSSSNVDARTQGVGDPSRGGSGARRQQPSQAPHPNLPAPRMPAATTAAWSREKEEEHRPSQTLVSVPPMTAAPTAARSREKEEEYYLSRKLDPSDVKSILYHAKAVYLTLDYHNTRQILDILSHHLLIDEEMLRAKVFGYAISYYRQRNFPPALERLDELEKLALEHHSAGDDSLSCIYRGEVYMAQKKLDQAFRMFDHARATYDGNNVSKYYGIIILSKCAVMVKAANCQKQLMDYRKAKEVYHMAIEFAEKIRHAREALPLDEPDRKNKVEAAYRDEITARCSLGNLFQNMSDCANAIEQYEIVLHLQEKIEGDKAALGWAEGNYGNALLGLNRLKEAIPHLQKAFDISRAHERGNQGISRAASNLGNAFQAAKQYDDAQNSFEIALGHSVFSGDEAGHARALGNLGNVKLVRGEPLEALKCYTEALSLNCDDTSLYTAYQNRASVYFTLAAKVNEGVGEWDEVPKGIVPEEPREAISIQVPVEEQTKEAETINRQHMVLLPSEKTLPRGGFGASEEYFKMKEKDDSPSARTQSGNQGESRAASNRGNAFQAAKRYDDAQNSFEVAFGHSVFSGDEAGHACVLGNQGNVKLVKGERLEALRCPSDVLSLRCGDTSLFTAYQNRVSVHVTLAAKVNKGVGEWDEVPEDIVPEEPREAISIQLPVEEQTKEAETINCRCMMPSGKTLPRGGLDGFKRKGTNDSISASTHHRWDQVPPPDAWTGPDSCDEAGKVAFGQTAAKPEPNSDPRTIQAQYKPQEGANHEGRKQAYFSKKPTHKDVGASGSLQAIHDAGYVDLTELTWSREKVGTSAENFYVPEVPPTTLSIAVQREQRDSDEPQVALTRPGEKKVDLSRKTKAEPRPLNEPHTANVASVTAPPRGLQTAPASQKVANVQVAQTSTQPARPAQASDTGYGTGTRLSSRKQVGTDTSNVDNVDYVETPEGSAVEVATRSQSSAEPTFAHTSVADVYKDEQYCMSHTSRIPQPNTVHISQLTIGKTKRVSPMLKVLRECGDPCKYFDPHKFLEALQLDSLLPRKEVDTSLYITNRAKLEQMYPYLSQSHKDTVADVVHSTLKFTVSEEKDARAVIDKFSVSFRMAWNALKDCPAIRYLNVESLARKLVPHESMAKWMEKKDNWQGIVDELRYFLRLKAETDLTRPRVAHALLVTAGNVEFINDVMSAGLSVSRDNPTLPEICKFLSGIQELGVFDKVFTEVVDTLKAAGEWGLANELQERGATKWNPMHLFGLWLATADATTRPATWEDFVHLLRKAGVDEDVVQTIPGGPWDSHQSGVFHISERQQPQVIAKVEPELSTKQVDQPIACREHTWASATGRNKDVDANLDSKSPVADQQSSDLSSKSTFCVGPASLSNVDARTQGVGNPSQDRLGARQQPTQAPHPNLPAPRMPAATTAVRSREKEEEHHPSQPPVSVPPMPAATTAVRSREKEEEYYLSRQLDPSNVKSILYHAKAVYLTLDYHNTRRILDILSRHLLIDEEMLRAKVFGYAISYYRQRNFPPALERLDELEKLALEHHSAGDVSLSCIYRGEVYMAQKKLDQAFRMFDHARATYDENNVSKYYGIIISKHEVMMKARICQKELLGRCSLGNLHQIANCTDVIEACALEALRDYNETLLPLNCDYTSLYQNRALVYITLAAKVNEGVGEWDEVPEDIVPEEPREAISIQLPVEEQTKEVESINRQHMVLPSGKTLPRGGLDDSEEYFKKKRKEEGPSPSDLLSRAGSSVPSAGGPPPPQGSSTRLGTSHTHYLQHRKFYLQKAEGDLRKVVRLVEDRFAKVKGKEDTNSLALSIFEANSKAFYSLQKVLVCLGRRQEALMVAEANRARNLGEVMSAKQSSTFSLSNVKVPLDLSRIWSFANSEQTPVAVLSSDVSCIMVHIILPWQEQGAQVQLGGFECQQTFTSSFTRGIAETIPANCYHFVKIELFTDTFTDEWSRNREARPTSSGVPFEHYVTRNLMDFLNEKESNLFEPVDFEPRDNPLTVLYDLIARKFAEVIEATAPEFHELVVIADQTLHLLPWPVLQDKSSRKFLGDHYRIRTYPSILTMGVISSQPAPVITLPSEERFLVVGNPAIPKFINQKEEVTLGPLPHAEDEAIQVSHILETNPLLREQATKQTVIYRLQMANIVHIATHGSGSQGYIALAGNMPVLSSANAVAVDAEDCLLFIEEIQKLHITASLVVLSACDSARGEIVNEGVNSVARAILAAGAQSVLVSLVRVPDKSASIFMRLFYRFLAHDGMTTSEALQKSSMGVRCIKSLSQHVHWGGFQLIGWNIRMEYKKASDSAKVASLVGDPTPFPRLELLKQLEKAIFRKDRTPPRDVVLVKGLSFLDPAEVVRDFICKHFKHYPGGVFWYNAASEDLLDASVAFMQQTVPHLKTIQREPPVEKVNPDKKKTLLDGSGGGEFHENHYRLVIVDHPADLDSCLDKIPGIHSCHSDVIIIHTADTDRDQSLTRWVDEKLVRGCTHIVVGHLDKYESIQRMAYSILRGGHITPYEEDYEAFDVLQQFCCGCSSVVRMLEGMLCREEPEMELRQLASDIAVLRNMEPNVVTWLEQEDLPQTSPAAEMEGNDYEKPARLLSPIGALLDTRMTQEEHVILNALGYLTLYPEAHPEGIFTFTDKFLNQLASVITNATAEKAVPLSLVKKLEELHVIRPYPLPVLSPPDYKRTFKLLYVPDPIVRAVTIGLKQGNKAFILSACSTAVEHLSEALSYHSALKKKVALLYAQSELPSLQQ